MDTSIKVWDTAVQIYNSFQAMPANNPFYRFFNNKKDEV